MYGAVFVVYSVWFGVLFVVYFRLLLVYLVQLSTKKPTRRLLLISPHIISTSGNYFDRLPIIYIYVCVCVYILLFMCR